MSDWPPSSEKIDRKLHSSRTEQPPHVAKLDRPRNPFRRQDSEQRAKLTPVEPPIVERRAVSIERHRALSARPASPPPVALPKHSAFDMEHVDGFFPPDPEISLLGNDCSSLCGCPDRARNEALRTICPRCATLDAYFNEFFLNDKDHHGRKSLAVPDREPSAETRRIGTLTRQQSPEKEHLPNVDGSMEEQEAVLEVRSPPSAVSGAKPRVTTVGSGKWGPRIADLINSVDKLLSSDSLKVRKLDESNDLKRRSQIPKGYLVKDASEESKSHSLSHTKVKLGLPGYINGKDAAALADTGSRTNVISAAFAVELGLRITGSSSIFQLGNSHETKSIGIVRLKWAFAEDRRKNRLIVCHVLPHCIYDLILGNGFLRATESLTKHSHRLSQCSFPVNNNYARFGYLGEGKQKLKGTLADSCEVMAVPDTGAERNVMDLDYALRMAFTVKRGPEDREEIQLADGTIQETAGRVDTYWKFKNDELVPITFEVLENCCSDVVVGEEFLSDHEVFHKQLSSLVDTRWNINFYELAPFDFVRKWQRPFQELSQTLNRMQTSKVVEDEIAQKTHQRSVARMRSKVVEIHGIIRTISELKSTLVRRNLKGFGEQATLRAKLGSRTKIVNRTLPRGRSPAQEPQVRQTSTNDPEHTNSNISTVADDFTTSRFYDDDDCDEFHDFDDFGTLAAIRTLAA